MSTTNKSELTAIPRKRLPTPTRYLINKRLLRGIALDYGCGRCHKINNTYVLMDGWDPYYKPDPLRGRRYHTIICNYVLNVIESARERQKILYDIDHLLLPTGKAYISVRADIKVDHYTNKGTWQGIINLPYKIQTKQSGFRMYVVEKGFSND